MRSHIQECRKEQHEHCSRWLLPIQMPCGTWYDVQKKTESHRGSQKTESNGNQTIRTEEEYQATMARIEEIFGIPSDSRESDELEILLALTGAYEKKHHHIDPPDPVAMLEYRMDQMGLSQEDIKRFMESRKKVPEILSRESGLSIEVIKSLQDIPFEAFTADSPDPLDLKPSPSRDTCRRLPSR